MKIAQPDTPFDLFEIPIRGLAALVGKIHNLADSS